MSTKHKSTLVYVKCETLIRHSNPEKCRMVEHLENLEDTSSNHHPRNIRYIYNNIDNNNN